MQINGYGSYGKPLTPSTDRTEGDEVRNRKDGSALGIDDFLNLLAAQLANQDPMTPTDNTAFIAQLAQFSSLQAMDTIAKITYSDQATSMVGKRVIMASYDKKGELELNEGVVEKATIFGGEIVLYVNGKSYNMSNIMEIKSDDAYGQIGELSKASEIIDKNVVLSIRELDDNGTPDDKTDDKFVWVKVEGMVEKAAIVDGKIKIYIKGEEYDYSSIIEIKPEVPEVPEDQENQEGQEDQEDQEGQETNNQ